MLDHYISTRIELKIVKVQVLIVNKTESQRNITFLIKKNFMSKNAKYHNEKVDHLYVKSIGNAYENLIEM